MPVDFRFQHHGEPVETREQWLARQAAEAAARAHASAEAQRRAFEAAQRQADAEQAEARQAAETLAATRRRNAARQRVGAALFLACGIIVVIALGSFSPAQPNSDLNAGDVAGAAIKDDEVGPPLNIPGPPMASPARPRSRESKVDIFRGSRAEAAWADDPSISPQPGGWWCLCYKTRAAADRTACRRLASECAALLQMIQTQGSASILPGSAAPDPCRHVPGPYPWLRLGHRAQWMPSSFPGAAQARDVCAL